MSAVIVTALCWLGWLMDVSCHCHSSVLAEWLMDVSCHCHSSVLAGVVDGCQLSLPQLCAGWGG